jgi:menaquinone-dependent protoporphyrinogen oxidase
LGASIRYGKHQKSVFNFINKHKDLLETKKSAFFSVNVVARKSEKNSPNTNPYMKKFLKTSRWTPNKLGVFAGKVDYPSYKFFDKYIIRMIMWITKGPTDISQSYEFTDWKVVENFAKTL